MKPLISEDCNVISVDWAPLAGPAPWYGVAVANARKVGARWFSVGICKYKPGYKSYDL